MKKARPKPKPIWEILPIWKWIVVEVEIQQPDHKCTPDCEHWKNPGRPNAQVREVRDSVFAD